MPPRRCWPRPESDHHGPTRNSLRLMQQVSTAGGCHSSTRGQASSKPYDGLVAERVERKPLQHIVGTAAFGPVTVHVGPGVFIPRPETEAMLEWSVAQRLPQNPVIVDLCTGSGALAFALSKNWPAARIVAVDDSDDCARVRGRNLAGYRRRTGPCRRHRSRVCCLNSTAASTSLSPTRPTFPTVRVLEPEVAEHDPPHALFGGPDGMAVIDAIAEPGCHMASRQAGSARSSTTTPPRRGRSKRSPGHGDSRTSPRDAT